MSKDIIKIVAATIIGVGVLILGLLLDLRQSPQNEQQPQRDTFSPIVCADGSIELKTQNDNGDNIYIISHRGIQFEMIHFLRDVYIPRPQDMPVKNAAIIASNAILHEFGVCIDGLDGYMHFFISQSPNFPHGIWVVIIRCVELSAHSWGTEAFYVEINAETGEILVLNMNTPENPFQG